MLVTLGVANVAADRGAGLGRDNDIEPFGVGRGVLGAQDFDLIAVAQDRVQRPDLAVDARADTGVADVRVHGVGKVDHGRIVRQRDQVPLWGETENLILEQVELGVVEELLRILGVLKDIHQLLDPVVVVARRLIGRNRAVLVGPVCRQPQLSLLVHVVAADLDFDRLVLRPDDHGMDRLVAVGLGCGDVVLVAAHAVGVVAV